MAAKANPAIIAPNFGDGGGPYDDKNLDDDFYWAAAELFVTTKKAEYKDFIVKADDFKKVTADWSDNPGMRTSMTWGDTHALGSISLAIVPNPIGKDVVDAIRKNIVAAADGYMELIQKQGYRLPFGVPKNGYPWGSNSFVVNNALIIALAHDLTKDGKYLNGVVMGMDYVLGRNASDQSYVTGYGDRPLENPYHRFWCVQANPKYPPPPPGILSGGPNSALRRSLHAVGGAARAARRRSASWTTARRGRRTRSPSTGTRRCSGSRRTSTRRQGPKSVAAPPKGMRHAKPKGK